MDEATLSMVDELITKGTPIELAIRNTVARVGLDPEFNAFPKYHPAVAKERTIHELYK